MTKLFNFLFNLEELFLYPSFSPSSIHHLLQMSPDAKTPRVAFCACLLYVFCVCARLCVFSATSSLTFSLLSLPCNYSAGWTHIAGSLSISVGRVRLVSGCGRWRLSLPVSLSASLTLLCAKFCHWSSPANLSSEHRFIDPRLLLTFHFSALRLLSAVVGSLPPEGEKKTRQEPFAFTQLTGGSATSWSHVIHVLYDEPEGNSLCIRWVFLHASVGQAQG